MLGVGALLQGPQQRRDVGLLGHGELERSPLGAVGLQRGLRGTADGVALLSGDQGLTLSGDLRFQRRRLLALGLEGQHVERAEDRRRRDDGKDDPITFAEGHWALPDDGVAAVDAVGVAAGVAVDEAGVVAAAVAPVLADDESTRDSANVTGKGHPPDGVDELEFPAPVPLSDVEDSETEPTPWTRPSATMVAATADSLAAQPEIWIACAAGVVDVAPGTAVAAAAAG